MSIISESENHYERILRERDELAALLAAEKATRNSIIEKGVKTERELVEVREDVRTLQDAKRKHEHNELVAAQENDRLKRERDEARKEIDDIRKMLSQSGEAIGNGVHDFSIIEMVENIIQSKNYFIKKSDSAEWERDEARRHLKEIEEYGTEEINAAVEIRQKLAHALVALDNMQERERDEARDENTKLLDIAEQAIDDLAWFNYSNAQRLRNELNQLKEGGK